MKTIRLFTPRDPDHGHWETPSGEFEVHSLPRVGDLIKSPEHETLLRVLHVVHTLGNEDDGFPIPFVSVYAVPATGDCAHEAFLPMGIKSAR